MRIAIPTNDRETLFSRTGQARQFAIYDIESKSVLFVEFRKNPVKHEEEQESHSMHNHSDLIVALKDCEALLVVKAGKKLREDFNEAKIALYKTEDTQLSCIANSYAKNPKDHPEI